MSISAAGVSVVMDVVFNGEVVLLITGLFRLFHYFSFSILLLLRNLNVQEKKKTRTTKD